MQQQRWGVAPAIERERDLRAHALHLGAAELSERTNLGGDQQFLPDIEVGGRVFRSAATSARIARWPGSGSAHRPSQRSGRGCPAAALSAVSRPDQFGGHLLIGLDAAEARCQARRSGSTFGSVAAASAAWAIRRSSAVAAR